MLIDSLLLDESDDISILRMLGALVIYYSNNCGKVVLIYLDHIKIEMCDAENIVSVSMAFLAHDKFDIGNLDGIGNNNASIMVGMNNGMHTKLEKVVH